MDIADGASGLNRLLKQKDELALTRDNHAAVMRELKRMQDEPAYISAWEPKTVLDVEPVATTAGMRMN